MKKDAPGKIFECLRGKIMSIRKYYYTNVKLAKNIEKRFQIRNRVMKLDNANNSFFFPYGHPLLNASKQEKKFLKLL